MSQLQRIKSLHQRRQDLKGRIAAEAARPQPDDLALRRMKAEKCRLKDEIATMERGAVVTAA